MSELETANLEHYLDRFGLSSFRPGQRKVIETVMSGQDCLCVMPTGGGKSLCYQLPALAMGGVTLVISPLIALMKDQVDQLQARGIRATYINSTLDPAEQYARLDGMAAGEYELVYVVPERFRSTRFHEAVRRSDLKLLAVDEAHCISEWGHDFRPDYARIGRFRAMLGHPTTIALTATATDLVRRDIVELLNLHEPKVFVTGFDRPNLFYAVQTASTHQTKNEQLVDFLSRSPGTGIIYANSRKRCEEVAGEIRIRTGRSVCVYHAGLERKERHQAQDDFMSSRSEIVVATTAFGMGIDKSDVRFVVHYNLPGTLEAYYQEAGRAGRDGKPSECLLLYSYSDRKIQEFFIESAYPSPEITAQVYDYLRKMDDDLIQMSQLEIRDRLRLDIGPNGVAACEMLLEKAGAIERLERSQNMATIQLDSELPTLVELLPRNAAVQRRVLRTLEKIVGPRRGEQVYFLIEQAAEASELDRDSFLRALAQLTQFECIEYIPPFRGRAMRVIDRSRRFDSFEIDFQELDLRKRSEYQKLDRMIDFARTASCRQATILDYFGDTGSGACGHCDNCRSRPGAARSIIPREEPTDAALTEAARIALSGVARVRERFGRTTVAQMLQGATGKKVDKLGLKKLSTYGLLSGLTQVHVNELLDGLTMAGYLAQQEIERFKPILKLTETGWAVMRGEQELGSLQLTSTLRAAVRSLFGKNHRAAPSSPITPSSPTSQPSPSNDAMRKVGAPVDRQSLAPATSPSPPSSPPARPVLGDVPSKSPSARNGLLFHDDDSPPAAFPASNSPRSASVSTKPPVPSPPISSLPPPTPPPLRFDEPPSTVPTEPSETVNAELWAKLQHWRKEESVRTNLSPAYVLSNAAMLELARRQPKNTAELMQIKGFGPTKTDRYGPALLAIVAGRPLPAPASDDSAKDDPPPSTPASSSPVASTSPASASAPTPSSTTPASASSHPTHYWTWRLLTAGFKPSECAAIRGLEPQVILDHALRAQDSGLPVKPEWFLSPRQLQAIDDAVGPHRPERIRPLLDRLPGVRYEEIQLFLNAREAKS